MTEKEFLNYCLNKKGAYLDFPFGDGVAVVKVGKRIFAQLFELRGVTAVTLNCTFEGGLRYRSDYP
jgi:predicted DNA-binding protein (MmcQ/YjbR family)